MHVGKHLHLQDRIATAFPREPCEPPRYLPSDPDAPRQQGLGTLFTDGLCVHEKYDILETPDLLVTYANIQ